MAKAATKAALAKGKGPQVPATTTKKEVGKSNVDLAALYRQDSGDGTSTDMADNVVPLIKCLQSLSPQVLKQKPEFIKGAEAGMIWARGTKDVWNVEEEPLRIVPCHYVREWLEWGPERGDGLRGRHPGKDDVPQKLGATRQKNADGNERWVLENGNVLQDCRNHVVLVLDKYDTPTAFSLPMTGSNVGTSRNWHPLMNRKVIEELDNIKAPSYAYVYELKTVARSNDKGDWFQLVVEDTGDRTEPEVYLMARQIAKSFKDGDLRMDVDGGEETTDDDGI